MIQVVHFIDEWKAVIIDNNLIENSGGGVYAPQENFVTTENSNLDNNIADYGGAILEYTLGLLCTSWIAGLVEMLPTLLEELCM